MKISIKVIAPILQLELSEDCLFYAYKITNDKAFIEANIPHKSFCEPFGQIAFNTLYRNPIIYKEIEVEFENFNNLKLMVENEIKSLIFFLWFLEDNSCNVNKIFFLSDIASCNFINTLTFHKTRSDGTSRISLINQRKIESIKFFILAFGRVSSVKELAPNQTTINSTTFNLSHSSSVHYNGFNRLERAFLFIQAAISSSTLPEKVLNYTAFLECLFSTSSSEVIHQVSENVAHFIGQTTDEKYQIYRFIKKAYDLRSKYVHGEALGKSFKTLGDVKNISQELDGLTRNIFSDIIAEKTDMFLSNDLDDFFKKQLFKNANVK